MNGNFYENMESGDNEGKDILKRHAWDDLTPITYDELSDVFNRWLLIEDKGILKVTCASVIGNKLPTSPVWTFLVAPSGGGKTEFIKALNKIDYVYPLSTLTSQTFISGMRGKDSSLLPQITGKIVTFKDFTTILQSHPQTQSEILAQLREIYDGYYKKDFGTGARKAWEGKIGFIAGVTSIIDQHHNVHKSLGERFLQYRIIQPDRMAVMDRIESNVLLKKEMDEELSTALARFIKGVEIPENIDGIPSISEEMRLRMKKVASFVSVARSAVIRNTYTKQIDFVPDKEMTTRIYSQIYTVALALMVINKDGSLKEDDYKILFKLGFDSIHYLRRKVLEILREYKGWVKTQTVATRTDYSTPTIRNYIEELMVLGLAERMKPRDNLIIWRLKPEYRALWKESELVPSETADGTIADEDADKEALKGEVEEIDEDLDWDQIPFEPPSSQE